MTIDLIVAICEVVGAAAVVLHLSMTAFKFEIIMYLSKRRQNLV